VTLLLQDALNRPAQGFCFYTKNTLSYVQFTGGLHIYHIIQKDNDSNDATFKNI
jgi:hypothetical protein